MFLQKITLDPKLLDEILLCEKSKFVEMDVFVAAAFVPLWSNSTNTSPAQYKSNFKFSSTMSKYYSFDSCGIVTGKMFLSLIGTMSNKNIFVKAKKPGECGTTHIMSWNNHSISFVF